MPVDTYLAVLLKPICRQPEAVQVSMSRDDMGILLNVQVDKDDMGVIIGKEGETAKAIRHLVRIAGIRQNARVSIKILEPDGSSFRTQRDDDGGNL